MSSQKEVVPMHQVGADGKRYNTLEGCEIKGADVELVCDNSDCCKYFTMRASDYRKAVKRGSGKFYCSKQCRVDQNHKNSLVTFNCGWCGTSKTIKKDLYNRSIRRIYDSENRGPFCSPRCASLDYNWRYKDDMPYEEHVKLTCSNPSCGKTFYRKRYEYAKSLRKGHVDHYCSSKCSSEHHRYKNTKKCLVCGNPVTLFGRSSNSKYCSRDCWRTTLVPEKRTCEECGTEFYEKTYKKRYCSRNCADEVHSRRMVGENNPNYGIGQSTKGIVYSHNGLFHSLKRVALIRDGYKCAVCGVSQEDAKDDGNWLVVHHCDHDKLNDRLCNYLTLCHSCHMIHHSSKVTPYPWLEEEAMLRTEEANEWIIEKERKILDKFRPYLEGV